MMKNLLVILMLLSSFSAAANESAPINIKSYINSCDDTHCIFNLTVDVNNIGKYKIHDAKIKESKNVEMIYSSCNDQQNRCLIMINTCKEESQILEIKLNSDEESINLPLLNLVPDYYFIKP